MRIYTGDKIFKIIASSAILLLIIASAALFFTKANNTISQDNVLGIAEPNTDWFHVNSFSGYQTDVDPSKVPKGANPMGQNTTANNRDRISIRQSGLDLFPAGTASSTEEAITSLHNFRKRSGENIMMSSHGKFLDYFEEGNDTWEVLNSGYTSGQLFGYADYNINTDLKSYVYFGNAVENFSRWTGAHSLSALAIPIGTTTIIVIDTSAFNATGTVVYCGATSTYSSVDDDTNTFTLSATTTISCALNRGVAQAVEEFTDNPKGNIYLAANNRIFIAGIASSTQAVFFSEYAVATNFGGASIVLDGTDTSPGVFNLGAGGGSVTGMITTENSIYIFKRSIIWRATLTDTIYTLTPLKEFDGKSQTNGAVGNNGLFAGGNAVFFATPDNQLMALTRVETIDEPQIQPVSRKIQPTVDQMNFDSSVGIVFRDKAYFSQKADTDVSVNNVVLIWNIKEKIWDSPIIGWNVSDFVVYDDGDGEELYIGNGVNPNVYRVSNTPLDDIFDVKANWRSKQFDFDTPAELKQMTNFYVEGYITSNTTLNISLLLDEDGFTQTFTTRFLGTEVDYLFSEERYNVFGLTQFGTERFGSNADFTDKRKFRVYLNKDFRPDPFYNVQVEFASDGENQNWEITNFSMKVRKYSQPERRSLYRKFQ